jgi:hypothetical protein
MLMGEGSEVSPKLQNSETTGFSSWAEILEHLPTLDISSCGDPSLKTDKELGSHQFYNCFHRLPYCNTAEDSWPIALDANRSLHNCVYGARVPLVFECNRNKCLRVGTQPVLWKCHGTTSGLFFPSLDIQEKLPIRQKKEQKPVIISYPIVGKTEKGNPVFCTNRPWLNEYPLPNRDCCAAIIRPCNGSFDGDHLSEAYSLCEQIEKFEKQRGFELGPGELLVFGQNGRDVFTHPYDITRTMFGKAANILKVAHI